MGNVNNKFLMNPAAMSSEDRKRNVVTQTLQICDKFMKYDNTMTSHLSFLSHCGLTMEGQEADSASSSDILILTDKNNNKMVMKYFITSGALTVPLVNSYGRVNSPEFDYSVIRGINQQPFKYQEQIYELLVYANKIAPLVKYDVCPYFVEFYGGNLDITFDQMYDFIFNTNLNTYEKGKRSPITEEENNQLINYIYYNFSRNSVIMANHEKYTQLGVKRPSLLNPSVYNGGAIPTYEPPVAGKPYLNANFLGVMNERLQKSNYGYIVSKFEPFAKLSAFHTIKKSDGSAHTHEETGELLKPIIFQLAIACYAMYLSGLAHNDLHYDNVFIKDLGEEKNIVYFIERKRYEFKTRYIPLVYDFDRSYVVDIKQPKLFNFTVYGQSNDLINGRDFVKILCYITNTRRITGQLLKDVMSSVAKSDDEKVIESNIQRLGSKCWLEGYIAGGDNKLNYQSYYDTKFYNCREIIHNLSQKFGYENKNFCEKIPETSKTYYLYSDFFNDNTLDPKLVNNVVRRSYDECASPLEEEIESLKEQIKTYRGILSSNLS